MEQDQKFAEAIRHLLSGLATPLFLAGLDQGERPILTAYTGLRGKARQARMELIAALLKAGLRKAVRVRVRHERGLGEESSLEALTKRFPHETIIYDPLGCFGRAREYVQFAGAVRGELGTRLIGVYLEPVRRTVYLVLDSAQLVHGQVVRIGELRDIENAARKALAGAYIGVSERALPAVRIGMSYPSAALVPVDEASAPPPRRRVTRLKAATGIAASIAALFGLLLPGSAKAEGPAVSAPNAKISGSGGAVDDSGAGIAAGSFTMPVGPRYGFQFDGAGGVVDGEGFGGVGAHLFWRDPDQALLGAIASYSEWDDSDVTRLGAEGELYLGQFSILARGGYQFGDYDTGDGDEHGPFGAAELRWYATDNFVLGAGVGQDDDKTRGMFTAEFQPGFSALPGLSLFADGEVGEDDYYAALVGIRYYFADPKSLKDRHRKDDPVTNLVRDSLYTLHRQQEDDEYGGPPPDPGLPD